MIFEEMVSVLKKTNSEREDPIPEHVLEEVLALVIKNPLDGDRGKCQDQLELVISQGRGG